MSAEEFTYDRIDMDRPAFRLIRLLGGLTADIHCELFEAYLDEVNDGGIPYEALSYTWGDLEKCDTIQINGMKKSVTKNLYVALNYLRPVGGDRILWIDAVCIDQGNQTEKGHQVQQMGKIYQTAQGVIIWLGPGSEDSDALMGFLGALPSNTEVHSASQLVPRDLQARYRESMEKLLDRPWFRRVWVIQEVAKARRAIVACGWKSVSTRVFTKAPSLLGLEPDLHSKAILDVMPSHFRAGNWYNRQPTLHTLLQNFQRSEATDKRDMIYALVGMSSSVHERSQLQADYEKDLQQLIRDTTSILLFPGHTEPPDLFYIDWNWSEFIHNLKVLRSAAFLCALRNPISEPERFIDISWNGPEWDDFAVECKDREGRTALRIAAEYGHEGIVKALLKQDGININVREDNDGRTPLYIAAERGHEGIVKVLLEQDGIGTNIKVDKDRRTPSWRAAEQGYKGIIKVLLERDGIDINIKNKSGRTLLWIAAERGYEGIVKMLLERDGIDINIKDKGGKTPLWIAAERGHEGIVKVLLERDGIDINVKDRGGRTPLQIAAQWARKGVIRLLSEHENININVKDKGGVAPSWTAA